MIERASSLGGAGAESGPAPLVQAVLFDLDGTLIDTVALILASMKHATQTVLGQAPSDQVLMRSVGIPLATQMREISPEHAEELILAYRAHNWEVHDEMIAEYPGTEKALAEIAMLGLPMGIVTSKSRRVAIRGLELFGLTRYFDVVVCSDDTEVHKPDPYPLKLAADQLGISLSHCAYVGDSPYDMEAAVRGGAYAIAALWGAFCEEELLSFAPARALGSIAELPDAVRSLMTGQSRARVEH